MKALTITHGYMIFEDDGTIVIKVGQKVITETAPASSVKPAQPPAPINHVLENGRIRDMRIDPPRPMPQSPAPRVTTVPALTHRTTFADLFDVYPQFVGYPDRYRKILTILQQRVDWIRATYAAKDQAMPGFKIVEIEGLELGIELIEDRIKNGELL